MSWCNIQYLSLSMTTTSVDCSGFEYLFKIFGRACPNEKSVLSKLSGNVQRNCLKQTKWDNGTIEGKKMWSARYIGNKCPVCFKTTGLFCYITALFPAKTKAK